MAANSGERTSSVNGGVEYAGFWARAAASFVDSVIITCFGLVLSLIGLVALPNTGEMATMLGGIVYGLTYLLYFPVMESSTRQATFGKGLVGIEVTDMDGRRLTFLRAFLRYIAKILSAIPLFIGFLLAAFTERKQALHDIIMHCLVVRTGPSHLLRAIAIAVGLGVTVGGTSVAYIYYVYLPKMAEGLTIQMQVPAKEAPAEQPVPRKPRVVKEAEPLEPESAEPVALKPDSAEKPRTEKAGVTTPVVASAAPEPEKFMPAEPVQTPQSTPAMEATISEPKTLEKSTHDMDVASQETVVRIKRYKSGDLRACLDLPANEAIAKCAGE